MFQRRPSQVCESLRSAFGHRCMSSIRHRQGNAPAQRCRPAGAASRAPLASGAAWPLEAAAAAGAAAAASDAAVPLVLGGAAADVGASGAGTGSGASARASGLGSTDSLAASFSSCCLYLCAAWDVYCRQQGSKTFGSANAALSASRDNSTLFASAAVRHGMSMQANLSGCASWRLRTLWLLIHQERAPLCAAVHTQKDTGNQDLSFCCMLTFCSILSAPSSDQPCCLKNCLALPLPPTLIICMASRLGHCMGVQSQC